MNKTPKILIYLSDPMIVFNLWAIVIIVQSLKLSWIDCRITSSVTLSILDVASSIKIILLLLKIALAIHTSCFSPALRFSPPSFIYKEKFSLQKRKAITSASRPVVMNLLRIQTFSRAFQTSVSLYWLKRSKLLLTVPLYNKGSFYFFKKFLKKEFSLVG